MAVVIQNKILDSMEGATMSGHLAAAAILEKAELAKNLAVS